MEKSIQKSRGLSVAAMVCGICSFILGFIPGILAFVLGIMALVKVKKGEADGKGMAIAGIVTGSVSMILFIVFIVIMLGVSLPTLQKSQADTQRRDDYATIVASVASYLANNGGNLPSVGDKTFAKNYLSGLYDPGTGLPYSVVIRENSGIGYKTQYLNKGDVIIEVGSGYDCQGVVMKSKRNYRLLGYLESGEIYCIDY